MRLRAVRVTLSLLLFMALPACADEVYRWTDATGAVSYGERPPVGARNVRRVDVDNISVIPAGDHAADQRLVDAYSKARSDRLQQEALESRIAADKARADLDRQTASLDAQRAQAEATCASSYVSGCGDSGGGYTSIAGIGGRGYGAYGPQYGSASGGYGAPPESRPRPAPIPAPRSMVTPF